MDHCSTAVVSEIEGVGKWLSTDDRTNCEVFGSVPRRARYVSLAQEEKNKLPLTLKGRSFCSLISRVSETAGDNIWVLLLF